MAGAQSSWVALKTEAKKSAKPGLPKRQRGALQAFTWGFSSIQNGAARHFIVIQLRSFAI
ncbi:MAG: hypothetical protein LCH89_02890 [Proteobacteria bacterium]|nr:hypothetical protein [Pseudomonadota bacterium]